MSHGTLTLDQLIGLNDELAALARIGVPFEVGLTDLDRDLSGQLGKVTQQVRVRLESGRSLAQVVAESPEFFPGSYGAIVRAGIRTGRLPAALESVSRVARQVADLQHTLRGALLYPLLLILAGYAIFVSFVMSWPQQLLAFRANAQLEPLVFLERLHWLGRTAYLWAPWPPLIVMLIAVVWVVRTRCGKQYPARGLRRLGSLAVFTELLATLVAQQVPLDEAVALAAEASGDTALSAAALRWSDQIRRGQGTLSANAQIPGVPDWLTWLISRSGQESEHAGQLRHAAQVYRSRLTRKARWYTQTLPVLLACTIGIAVVAILVGTILAPFYFTLLELPM